MISRRTIGVSYESENCFDRSEEMISQDEGSTVGKKSTLTGETHYCWKLEIDRRGMKKKWREKWEKQEE